MSEQELSQHETIAEMTNTIAWHQQLIQQNQDVIAAEYLSLNPDIDKIGACKEEVWFHTYQVKIYVAALVEKHLSELLKI